MNLTINSTFRPFTFDEMIKPFMMYKEAYEKQEEDYSNLVAQAEAWKDIANRENSPQAYAMYERYMNDLNSFVGDFSANGLSAGTRRGLMAMKGRYAQDILPIERAHTAMKEANDLRDKLGPDAIFEVNRYNSIDDFLGGKTANNRYQSKEALTKKTATLRASINSA